MPSIFVSNKYLLCLCFLAMLPLSPDSAGYAVPKMAATLKAPHPLTGACLPRCFGHEYAGVITELGEEYSGSLAVGDKVAVMPTLTDGDCWACVNGHTSSCTKLGFLGIHVDGGGLSDRAVVPADLLFKLPQSMDCEVGGESQDRVVLILESMLIPLSALVEPVAVAWHSLKKADPPISPETSVLILGAGPVGCAVVLSLRAQGVKTVIVSEPSSSRRDFALRLGASQAVSPSEVPDTLATLLTTTGKEFDVVFDCAGIAGKTLESAVQSIRSQGTIVNLALQPRASIPLLEMIMKEVQLKCSLAYTREDYLEVIRAIDEGRLDPRPLISKRIRLENVVEEGFVALRDSASKECKILVDLEM